MDLVVQTHELVRPALSEYTAAAVAESSALNGANRQPSSNRAFPKEALWTSGAQPRRSASDTMIPSGPRT
jgi:hypothetical protein